MQHNIFADNFTEREQQEIAFALKYLDEFNHGTSGHMEYTVIAKLAALVMKLENEKKENE
jgi:hypothetical protein